MKSSIIIKEQNKVDFVDEVIRFSVKAGTVVCALIGIWAISCLVAGLIHAGPIGMVRGYITAILGN